MAALPHTDDDTADEVVMPRSHRNCYDHAVRLAGADVVDVAHDHDVPVIVDAAAELPPKSNLERFIDEGADLVVFSGGKAIRGPQSTGILAGKREYIESAAMQHLDMHVAEEVWEPPVELVDHDRFGGVPRQGIGRPLNVGKEEIAGLIRALELFLEEDTDALAQEWANRSETMAAAFREHKALSVTVTEGEKTSVAPEVFVELDSERAGLDVETLVAELRTENPRVFVGPDHLYESAFTVNPMCLTDDEADHVAERVLVYLDCSLGHVERASETSKRRPRVTRVCQLSTCESPKSR